MSDSLQGVKLGQCIHPDAASVSYHYLLWMGGSGHVTDPPFCIGPLMSHPGCHFARNPPSLTSTCPVM
jgi:hypothetical protein